MTDEQFDQLVMRIQERYGSRPWLLRARTLWQVLIGYAGFLAGLLVVLLIVIGLSFGAAFADKELGVFLAAGVAVLLTLALSQTLVFLWVPLQTDQARTVTEDEAPNLFRMLKILEQDYGTRPFHSVQITPQFNASVQAIPRWGVFGGCRSHLFIGLPLMQMLTPDQFAAVMAHEFGHISSRHDRFGTWIYRLRQTWWRVFQQLQSSQEKHSRTRTRGLIARFIDWYWPRMHAFAFVLSRADEYQADRLAADWGGVDSTAQALWRIECFGHRLHGDFWESLKLLARVRDEVPDDIVARMKSFLEQQPTPHDANRWIEQSMQALTSSADTHPSLSDRLRALEQDVTELAQQGFPSAAQLSADVALLEPALHQITLDVNAQWARENTAGWQNLFHEARRLEKQLESTAVEPATAALLTAEQQWERARTVAQLEGTAASEPLLRELLSVHPLHGPAILTLGCYLLERGHREGEDFLRRILNDKEHELTPTACDILATHFQKLGQSEQVRELRGIVSRFQEAQAAAMKERSSVAASDTFVAHGLTDFEVRELRKSLSGNRDIHSAWLVQKELRHFKKERLFVLVVRTKPSGLFGSTNADVDNRLARSLMGTITLPGRVLIIAPQGGFARLSKKILSMRDTNVFLRD
ncbi:MAG: M48 family metalloprotease [Planctomycetes bacterium]|nr:M48 family metalloprotease [Planctomycetota bacterium]